MLAAGAILSVPPAQVRRQNGPIKGGGGGGPGTETDSVSAGRGRWWTGVGKGVGANIGREALGGCLDVAGMYGM
jgi:hypothetical protein